MAAAPLLRLPPKLTTPTTVLWFRNNLRLDDNPALVAACRDATARGDALLPIVCLDAATGSDDDSTSTSTSSKVANNVNSPHHRRAPAAATLGASAPRTPYGSLKVGPYRAQFLLEAVDDLQQSWAAKYGGSSSSSSSSKSELVVLSGSAPDVIAALGPMVTTVHAPQETCYEETKCERDVATILKRHRSSSSGSSGSSGSGPGNGLVLHWEATLYHLDDLPTGSCDPDSMQLSFTPWKNKVEKQADLRPCVKAPASLPPLPSELLSSSASSSSSSSSSPLSRTPTLSELGYASSEAPGGLQDGRCALRFQGGESAAKERLQGWMFDRDCLKEYFEVRNGMLGADYSTKLAPWLALGCVSARRVASEVSRYESERMANTPRDERYNGRPNGNKSTYWVLFELLWRDFFRFASVKMGDDLFKIQGPVPRNFDGSGGGGGGGGKQHPKGASFAESAAKRWWRDPLTDPEAAAALKAWKEGRTGAPLVDANMRELAG
jgi:deoxyribodipyrimidine photo-lyase